LDGTSGAGNSAATNYIRSGYLYLAEFRPDAYSSMMAADLRVGGTTTAIDRVSALFWLKHLRNVP
jgi:hypothetical protein